MLSGIDNLQNLKILNISYNRLTNIDIVKGCKSLESIFAQGNQIKAVSFELKSLISLYLQEFNGEGQNPCCQQKSYKLGVLKLMP